MLQNGYHRRIPAIFGWLVLAAATAVLTGRVDPGAWAQRLSPEPPGGSVTVDGSARTIDDPLMRAAVATVTAVLNRDGVVGGPTRPAAGGHAVVLPYRLAGADWRAVQTQLGAVRSAYPQLRIEQQDRIGVVDQLLGRRAALAWLVIGGLLVAACAALDRRTVAQAGPSAPAWPVAQAGECAPVAQVAAASETASSNEWTTGRPVAYSSGGWVNPPAYNTQAAPTSAAA